MLKFLRIAPSYQLYCLSGDYLKDNVTWATWIGAWYSLSVRLCSGWTVLISFIAFRLAFYDSFLGSFSAAHTAVSKV